MTKKRSVLKYSFEKIHLTLPVNFPHPKYNPTPPKADSGATVVNLQMPIYIRHKVGRLHYCPDMKQCSLGMLRSRKFDRSPLHR